MRATEHDHDHQEVPSDLTLRVKALESLLVEKGLVDPAALDALIDTYEHKVGPRNGARVVARAWVDPAYKERLLTDATAAIKELGYTGEQGEHMMVVANGPKDMEMRVWDSTGEVRYLVLPERPANSEKLSEEELAALVTRDAMVGVAKVELPHTGANL